MIKYKYNDGGRKKAGFRGETHHDCVTRAIAIVLKKPYIEIYSDLRKMTKKFGYIPKSGVERRLYHKYLKSIGMEWTSLIVKGLKYHRLDDMPTEGRFICSVRGHLTAVVDGVIQDTFNPIEDGRRVVYGYYSFKNNKE